jgi:hypothetical protein
MSKLSFLLLSVVIANYCMGQKKAGRIDIMFEAIYKGEDNILNKKLVNDFGENYTITKLKFYVSNVNFLNGKKRKTSSGVYLIDASKKNTISMAVPSKNITGLSFLLGVDSALNCSGAQSGALDPLNDMFWTWNNGYINFKIEGNTEVSKADLHRIEHHIGGYKGSNKTMREIYLPINKALLKGKKNLVIQLDIDKYWNGINKLKMAEQPVISLPGIQAKNAADNFDNMFSIKDNK